MESSSNSSSGFDAADRGRNAAAAATAGELPGLPEGTHLAFTPEKSSPRNESAPSTPSSLKTVSSSSIVSSPVAPSKSSEAKNDRSSKHKPRGGSSSGQPKYQEPLARPVSPVSFGAQPRVVAKQQQQQQQQVSMPAAAEILAQHFVEENPNTVLSDATIVVDPNTNELKLSVSGTLHPTSENETAEESIQQFANSLQEQQLTVTVPLSVISSMNISGTNLVSVNAGTDDPNAALVTSSATTVTMHAGEIITTADVTSGEAEQQFIPAELIGQLPLVQTANGTELHDPNQYITTTTGQELSEHALISNYNDQINYTLQTLAQNLQNAEQLSGQTLQTDLSESIDDIVPTINLLPATANPLVLPQLQAADLADSIILTPNQLISHSLVEQHYIENVAIKPEMEILTVNTPVDISKLNLLRTVDAEFLKERHAQQQQQANTMYHTQIDDFRGVKMWYSNLPKPLHVNNFQLRKLGGGYVMNRKLLNIRKNLVSESNNLAKSLNSQLSPIGGPRSALNFNTSGARSGDLLSPITGMGKSKDTNGGLGLSSSPTANRLGQVNRGQRRLILPQASIKKPTEKTSCLLSNAYFKNLISSMQQQQQSAGHQPSATTPSTLKRPSSSSLTSLSNKRLKIINNLQNSTAPPQMLLQGSGKVKPKVL